MDIPPRSRGTVLIRAERSFVAREVLLPAQAFIHTARTSSAVLLLATITALVWANSPWQSSYVSFWETTITVDIGILEISEHLYEWVNDALMAIFFFVVGLEVKYELVRGELSDRRRAALPIVAALGGMAVPAVLFLSINSGGDGLNGWGIPVATDIAFALGILAFLGRRIPAELRVFLLALAVVDDIGAILIIAIFYTESISLEALGWASLFIAIIIAMNRLGVRNITFYVIMGTLFWLAVFESGFHATIAGVILGMLTPVHPYYSISSFIQNMQRFVQRCHQIITREHGQESDDFEDLLGQMEELTVGTEAPAERLGRLVEPWSSYIILPLFALANAGIVLSTDIIGDAATSSVTLGVLIGLLVGKPLGITLFSWLVVRVGIGSKPSSVNWRHIVGVGLLAGVGFTVSLFVSGLAFEGEQLVSDSKIGILIASVLAGVSGFFFLRLTAGEPEAGDEPIGRSTTHLLKDSQGL